MEMGDHLAWDGCEQKEEHMYKYNVATTKYKYILN